MQEHTPWGATPPLAGRGLRLTLRWGTGEPRPPGALSRVGTPRRRMLSPCCLLASSCSALLRQPNSTAVFLPVDRGVVHHSLWLGIFSKGLFFSPDTLLLETQKEKKTNTSAFEKWSPRSFAALAWAHPVAQRQFPCQVLTVCSRWKPRTRVSKDAAGRSEKYFNFKRKDYCNETRADKHQSWRKRWKHLQLASICKFL